MLSYVSPKDLMQAIASNDVKTIQSIKGIGLKTAQRVVIELQEKVRKMYGLEDLSVTVHNTNAEEALSALEVLAFMRKASEKVVNKILDQHPEATSEQIIKSALKSL